jgi:hypothetical protein
MAQGYKTGGRQKGTPNVSTQCVRELVVPRQGTNFTLRFHWHKVRAAAWTAKDGTGRNVTEIVADEVETQAKQPTPACEDAGAAVTPACPISDDDIPF